MQNAHGSCDNIDRSESDVRGLEQYVEKCWQGRLHFQSEKNRLLYWVGTTFVALLAATGVVNVGTGEPFVQFTFLHSVLFHAVFAVVWYYFLYKQLRMYQYDVHRKLAEQELRRHGHTTTLRFEELVAHQIRCVSKAARVLKLLPNVLMVIVYLAVSVLPVMHVGVAGGMVQVAWQGAASIVIGVSILLSGHVLYGKARLQLRDYHSRDLEPEDADVVACPWRRAG